MFKTVKVQYTVGPSHVTDLGSDLPPAGLRKVVDLDLILVPLHLGRLLLTRLRLRGGRHVV